MTVGAWLDERTPSAPTALRARVIHALGAATADDAAAATSACLAAAERLMEDLLLRDCTSRESALDLLAADALVTYAFEAASESPIALEQRATEALLRMAALGGAPAHQARV